jgi:exodeoxyribonuclease V beta subunit
MKPQPLTITKLPLIGRHLIEASAGTGKTHNITQIYLRLLLEKRLKVQDILVLTFTKAATEELKGRIDKKIREELTQRPEKEQLILQEALLNLDLAAIYTIHGFCQRVLTQQAFTSGLLFDLTLESDLSPLKLDAVRDWYRELKNDPPEYLLLSDCWPDPDSFYHKFGKIIGDYAQIVTPSPAKILDEYLTAKKQALENIQQGSDLIHEILINPHKDKDSRSKELEELLRWLEDDSLVPIPQIARQLYSGVRYSRKPPEIKSSLKELFDPLKKLEKRGEKIESKLKNERLNLLLLKGFEQIQQRIENNKIRQSVLDFDDLIKKVLDTLQGEQGAYLANEITEQYPAALIDEFQDTDPDQFAIFDLIYHDHQKSALYLIGDPKQAIYSFRKGDIFTYLKARKSVDTQWHLDTNWRSTPQLVTAYNRLFYGQSLKRFEGEATEHIFKFGITYLPVKTALKDICKPKTGEMPLTFTYFHPDGNFGNGKSNNQEFRSVIALWCAQKIRHLLQSKIDLDNRPIQEQDIAILVRDKTEAKEIQEALRKVGYSAVYLSNRENVFRSAEAIELQVVMAGIVFAEEPQKMVRALATSYFSLSTEQLWKLQEDESYWEYYRSSLLELRLLWLRRGFMVMALKLIHEHYRPEWQNRERRLTNTLHLLELVQEAAQRYRQPWELVNWLIEQRSLASSNETSELRLESDENLIQIITQHGAKGLEYSFVFIPFSTRFRRGPPGKIAYTCFHDSKTEEAQIILGSEAKATTLSQREQEAEDVRLLYVAITRAKYGCYLGVTPFSNYEKSALGLALGLRKGDELLPALYELAKDEPESIGISIIDGVELADYTQGKLPPPAFKKDNKPIVTQRFKGVIEKDWRINSFSALTRASNHGVISDHDRDEQLEDSIQKPEPHAELLRFTLKKGAATGNLLHDALEAVEFNQPAWDEALATPLTYFTDLDILQIPELIEWLDECLSTTLFNGPALRELKRQQTLRECEFYFPMTNATSSELNRILQKHRQNNQLVGINNELKLKGMMHGFIDLIFEWREQYFIVDYKSTHLGNSYQNYTPQLLQDNIFKNHYDLQYMIYSLALHRFLQQKLGVDYDSRKQLGGIYYLYLRGMKPGQMTGIFHTRLEHELLVELDQLFQGERVYV